ncbi:hypothetical protein [Spiroplasma ixodetis]|uniref:hypothetical protein n=1 Tax=Spiroplasma ixodetis TaxID=2141 RepID=UPI002578A169|nr:hypothetical protein [Spiroplasma ixodetis]WJG70449.1 hypothetical protein SIXOD_v1c16090 [Spiroplasma ixodetis Y32]
MNRKIKKITCAISVITDEQWDYEDVKDNLLGILLSFKNEIQYKNWNKILRKEFEENDIDFIFKFRLKNNKDDNHG